MEVVCQITIDHIVQLFLEIALVRPEMITQGLTWWDMYWTNEPQHGEEMKSHDRRHQNSSLKALYTSKSILSHREGVKLAFSCKECGCIEILTCKELLQRRGQGIIEFQRFSNHTSRLSLLTKYLVEAIMVIIDSGSHIPSRT